MSALFDHLRRGATLDAAAAAAGLDRELAALMVDHWHRAGLLENPPDAACADCSAAPRRPGCAGCPFARQSPFGTANRSRRPDARLTG